MVVSITGAYDRLPVFNRKVQCTGRSTGTGIKMNEEKSRRWVGWGDRHQVLLSFLFTPGYLFIKSCHFSKFHHIHNIQVRSRSNSDSSN